MSNLEQKASDYANAQFNPKIHSENVPNFHCTDLHEAFLVGYGVSQREYEEKNKWVKVREKLPSCYESGEWDGLRSEEIIFMCENGDKYVGRLYSGFIDGSHFNDFTDISSFVIPNVTEWRSFL